ncbi:hypothetical protein H8356DRAFT_1434448 [Neocallimastix lanati (nom. inval.)]|jgi:glutaminyl-peptide cyclotransferase|uniref:Peptide hydrolase n=1 Tax=Neocallimastix californiae TaxID=1754190 RepID=A0A1Y2D5Z9_9FUNG|nr:hypothetical protein H8356DRAFT_1434448 [Neocallimastix sp. JGI-2020a]ORY54627.1 hypothetical protein LY90DRAFT_702224 [Neocallimastix californiae]|eukprot:ORY54627.1 hypothetical protein LY90DRAFT_702224 [Neocallimastix californiae]
MNEQIPLVNLKKKNKRKRINTTEEEGLLNDNNVNSNNVQYMERYRGKFESKTSFLKKIFYGISFSILGIGSIFIVLLLIKLFGFGSSSNGNVSIENYVDIVTKHSKVVNLNIKTGELLTPLLVERVVGTESHKKVQEFIVNHFKGLQWEMEKDTFDAETPLGTKTFNNYIFTKNPLSERRIVLAAHYDSKYFKNEVFIGATDSAAPCAILMDIAESLNFALENHQKKIERKEGKEGLKNSTTIQMIFFDGEEAFENWTNTDSIYGSRHLAEKWENEPINNSSTITKIKSIDVLVLLDLLGTKNPSFINFYKNSEKYFNSLSDIEIMLSNQKLLSTSSNNNNSVFFSRSDAITDSQKLFIDDDHKPFLRKNVPILHIIPYPFPNVWHNAADNADALDENTIRDLSLIFKLFVVQQLQLNNY